MMNIAVALIVLGVNWVVGGCPIVTSLNGSCCEVISIEFKFSTSLRSRVYNITNFCGECEETAEGFCDGTTDGGGWLVVQRRKDGSIDFNRDWVDYEEGFGSLTGEFWYGLRPLHCLTKQGQWHLRVDYTFSNGTNSHLFYKTFAVGSASSQYQLTLSGFNGPSSSDPMGRHPLSGMKFSTKDRENDISNRHCAVNGDGSNAGGWWYNNCAEFNPNNQYKSIYSMFLHGEWRSLTFIEMKIKPSNCSA